MGDMMKRFKADETMKRLIKESDSPKEEKVRQALMEDDLRAKIESQDEIDFYDSIFIPELED